MKTQTCMIATFIKLLVNGTPTHELFINQESIEYLYKYVKIELCFAMCFHQPPPTSTNAERLLLFLEDFIFIDHATEVLR